MIILELAKFLQPRNGASEKFRKTISYTRKFIANGLSSSPFKVSRIPQLCIEFPCASRGTRGTGVYQEARNSRRQLFAC